MIKEKRGRPELKEVGEKRKDVEKEGEPKKKRFRQATIEESLREKTTLDVERHPLEKNYDEKEKNKEVEKENEMLSRNKGDYRFHDVETIWRNLEERREKQEREDLKRKKKAKDKEKSWEMIRFCKDFIKKHEGEWMKEKKVEIQRRQQEEAEDQKRKRFQEIKEKKERSQEKRNTRTLEEKIKRLGEEGKN